MITLEGWSSISEMVSVGFPYIHFPSKIAISQSNCSRVENCIEVCSVDISRSCRVFTIVLHYKVGGQNIRDYFLRVMFPFISLLFY